MLRLRQQDKLVFSYEVVVVLFDFYNNVITIGVYFLWVDHTFQANLVNAQKSSGYEFMVLFGTKE